MNGPASVSRRAVLKTGAAIGGLALVDRAALARGAEGTRPNILFILADDLGYADVGCYGRRGDDTPFIDRLAADGLRLTQGYSNSAVCSPTRVGLITGCYQDRFRVGLDQPIGADAGIGLPPEIVTLPSLLRTLGYRTSLIGKWHLGNPPAFGPNKSGYDSFFGFHSGATDYFLYSQMAADKGVFANGERVKSQDYLTDLLADRAISEIRSYAEAGTPFFMSLHFNAPHWPWEGPEDRNLFKTVPTTLDLFHTDGGDLATYAKMIRNMDQNIGRVLESLASAGLSEDTIVVFTSDNGGERFSDVWPFVGQKTELFEGGIRVPLIVSWPGRIPSGRVSEQVMISMDFMPTLLAAAGHGDQAPLQLDGMNLLSVLQGEMPVRSRKLFWRYKARGQAAVRDGNWKYLRIDGKEYLFDLGKDERERADLKGEIPDRFAQLKEDFEAWNATMLAYPKGSFSHDMRDIL